MSKKEQLKATLIWAPKEKVVELEKFIDNEISDNDIEKALMFLKENGDNHRISNLSYSKSGKFSIKLEIGVTYLN